MSKRKVEILCPKCSWRPRPEDRWVCRQSCRHEWNTFDTGGVCPACGYAWSHTQCLRCNRMSPHADWYRESIGGGVANVSAEKIRAPEGIPVFIRPRQRGDL